MKWVLAFVLCVIAISFAIFVYLQYLRPDLGLTSSQKKQALTNLLGRSPILSPADHSKWTKYKSSYISFSYPGWATIYTKDNTLAKKNPITLDSFHFFLSDTHIEGVMSATKHNDFSAVSDDSGVNLRLNDNSYTKVNSTSNSVQFFNNSTEERSYFSFKNGNIYSLVVIGGDDRSNKEIFEKIYSSLVF